MNAQEFIDHTRKTSIGLIKAIEEIAKSQSERKRIQKHLDSKDENELFAELYESVENFFLEDVNSFELNCIWYQISEDYQYSTDCGHYFNLEDQTPLEGGMKFCPFCSCPIEENANVEENA